MNNVTYVKEIDSIEFGVFSPQEIINMAVCKISSTKLHGPNSVYDERMGGGLDNKNKCITCDLSAKKCPGHFGYIELNEYIIHPLYYKMVLSFLKCFCVECHRLLILKEHIEINGLLRFKRRSRFNKILDKLEKVDICCHCNSPQPKITYSPQDNLITMTYKENSNSNDSKKLMLYSLVQSVNDIKKIFDDILDEDIILCGFSPNRIHPKNLILSIFPVIPPCSRPYVVADGNICDDDLTNQTIEIIKANNILKHNENKVPDAKLESRRLKALQSLKFRISTLFNNSQGKAKHPTNGRPIKGIKERLTGKGGQIRHNLMGKRVEFSARTVIGPDPNLKFGEMGIPKEIAQDLTKPITVQNYNKKYLTEIVNEGRANFIIKSDSNTKINLKYAMFRKGTELLYGDTVIRKGLTMKEKKELCYCDEKTKCNWCQLPIQDNQERVEFKVYNANIILQKEDQIIRNGNIVKNIKYPLKKRIFLNIGDIVYKQLEDGDIVLLNRQPTLHTGSMLAKRIRVLDGKTFRFNLATTKTFNADFDRKCGFYNPLRRKQGA